jgi:hypothetical protein
MSTAQRFPTLAAARAEFDRLRAQGVRVAIDPRTLAVIVIAS